MSLAPVVAPIGECDLFLFEVGGQVFAADPLDVHRVDRPASDMPSAILFPAAERRVLVGRGAKGEFQVPVDEVLGVRRFSRGALRRAPVLAQALGGPRANEVMGVVLDGTTPVLVIDLQALSARAQPGAAQQGT